MQRAEHTYSTHEEDHSGDWKRRIIEKAGRAPLMLGTPGACQGRRLSKLKKQDTVEPAVAS